MVKNKNNKKRKEKAHKEESQGQGRSFILKAANPTKYAGLLLSAAVVVLASFWRGGQWFSVETDLSSPLDRLMYHWPPGGPVTVQSLINSTDRGLVATQKITKGSIALMTDHVDLKGTLLQQQPQLKSQVEQMLQTVVQEQKASFATISTNKILAIIRFLQLVDIEKDPRWTAYADTLPKNVSSVAWYWTKEEWQCVVTNRTSEVISQNLSVFHAVMAKLAKQSTLVQQIYNNGNALRAEWALLMINVRGFGDLHFIPILDMANHNPLKAVQTAFQGGKIISIATQDIEPDQQVYNTYGELSPFETAIIYGFVQSEQEAAFFEVPSIRVDMWRSESTKSIPECTQRHCRFFGNTGHGGAFLPTEQAYQCLQKMLLVHGDSQHQNNDTDTVLLAQYVAKKLQADYQRYADLANAEHCQSNEGNFPLIRKASHVTAKLLWEAYEIANRAAKDETISYYPGRIIPS